MATSNWQNISWCVQAIMRIEPKRVLDVGVGFGRWGMIVREFAEVWYGRVSPDEWTLYVEGIEAFPKNLAPYHDSFYNRLHRGDANEVLFNLEGHWDLVILGDVLEHFVKGNGERILDHVVANSDYVLINLPLGENWHQEDKYGNPYQEHKAAWDLEDLDDYPVTAHQVFLDFDERPFASVLLSREDPRNLSAGFFGSSRQGELRDGTMAFARNSEPSDAPLQSAVEERLAAIESIRNSGAWRLMTHIRNNPLVWRGTGLLWPKNRGKRVSVKHLGRASDGSHLGELCILRVDSDAKPVFWDFLSKTGDWQVRPAEHGAFGECLVTRHVGAVSRWFDYGGSLKLTFRAHSGAGSCEIRCGDKTYQIDLQRSTECEAEFDCDRGSLDIHGAASPLRPARSSRTTRSLETKPLLKKDVALLEQLRREERPTLAVYVPDWTGVYNSTRTLFRTVRPLPAQLTPEARKSFLRLVGDANCENLVLSGGAVEHLHLCREIREHAPETKIKLLWHGSFLQVREDYAWRGLRLAFSLARQGILHAVGFVKEGMAEAAAEMGLRASFVMNYVPTVPTAPSEPADGGPHLGLWLSNEGWRKMPYAMAVAVRRIPDGQLHYTGDLRRLVEFCRLIGLRVQKHGDALLSQEQLQRWMRLMHINLYVTLSECSPMLPLESLSVGVPCLLGPNSHLFRDNDYLFDRLVVPFPDSSNCIVEMAERALAERGDIVRAYGTHALDYNRRAQASVAALLDL